MEEITEPLSPDEEERLTAHFHKMDLDGNGNIDREEARKDIIDARRLVMGNPPDGGLEKMADCEVNKMFASMDVNNDELISLEEYIGAMSNAKLVAKQTQERKKLFQAEMNAGYAVYAAEEGLKGLCEDEYNHHTLQFRLIDVNGDGCIERKDAVSELSRKMRAIMGNPPTAPGEKDPVDLAAEREVDAMFAKMDTNHDEVITFGEYLRVSHVPGKWDPEAQKAAAERANAERSKANREQDATHNGESCTHVEAGTSRCTVS